MNVVFDCLSKDGKSGSAAVIEPLQVPLWCAVFDVDDLTTLFDVTPMGEAVEAIDRAVQRYSDSPTELRLLLPERDFRGLRGNREILLKIRAFLVNHHGTISTYGEAVESE